MFRIYCWILIVPLFCLCVFCVTEKQASAGNKVRDQLGRQVEIPEDVECILPLAPSIAECVYLLGQWDKVVGTTRFTDFPPGTKDLSKIGSYVNLDLEKIVRLAPDLCLATKDGNPQSVVRELEQLGIPVYALDPRDMDAIERTMLKLGQLLNSEYTAKEVLQGMEDHLSGIKELVPRSASRPKVFFQIGISPIVSAGKNTIVHELIEIAGGKNAVHSEKPYPRYSREDILIMKPDIIVVSCMTNEGDNFKRVKEMWSDFDSIPAVSSGRIYSVDSDLILGKRLQDYSRRKLARSMAYVPQSLQVNYPFTVKETILMGRSPHIGLLGIESREDEEKALDSMRITQVEHLADRRMDQLSGGEQQRVLIARAISQEADVILLDEPTSSLDLAHQVLIMDMLEHLQKKQGVTILMVAHDLYLASLYGERIMLLKSGQVCKTGHPWEVLSFENLEEVFNCILLVDESSLDGLPRITVIPGRYLDEQIRERFKREYRE